VLHTHLQQARDLRRAAPQAPQVGHQRAQLLVHAGSQQQLRERARHARGVLHLQAQGGEEGHQRHELRIDVLHAAGS
jgi:hypothetical protein